MKKNIFFLIFISGLFFSGSLFAQNWQGNWETSLGKMTIYQNGINVTAQYGINGKITARVKGNTLEGTWYEGSKLRGAIRLQISKSGQNFIGNRKLHTGKIQKITGTKVSSLASGSKQPPVKQPPVKQPPVKQPPVKQPPVKQPPVKQPPVKQPPVKQPPVNNNNGAMVKSTLNQVNFSTVWRVEDASNGKNRDYDSVPWTFSPDGQVKMGQLWRGLWGRNYDNTIKIIYMDAGNNTGEMTVTFYNSGTEFLALKDGLPYMYGKLFQ